jgi:hypothetical protein
MSVHNRHAQEQLHFGNNSLSFFSSCPYVRQQPNDDELDDRVTGMDLLR